jgi:hypothetical protein
MSVKTTGSERIPKGMQATYDAITGITNAFCEEHLNEEYAELCRRMTAILARKRASPLSSGRPLSWASGIIYAIGRVNSLFDKSQKLHLMASELCELLGVSDQAASGKARSIMDMLKLRPMDPRRCLPSQLEKNPMAWMLTMNGYTFDVREASRDVQEEAYRRGLIPFIPEEGR